MKGSQEISRLYKRGGKIYYFQYTDATGKRCQKSTGQTNKQKAIEFANRYIGNSDNFIESSLIEYVSLFCDIKTNPKKKMAEIDGSAYSISYGELQTRYAKKILDTLKNKPILCNKKLSQIKRYDIIQFKELIVYKIGRSRTAQLMFEQFKVILTFAYKEGLIENNTANGIPNIKYKENKRLAISATVLSDIISNKEIFPSLEFWAFFTVLATTGMRRGEVLGITPSRITNNILIIDRQWNGTQFIPPKQGEKRVIPLSNITMEALSIMWPKNNTDRFFTKKNHWILACFRQIKGYSLSKYPQETNALLKLSPHTLRHSCNTNLLAAGTAPLLVAEYLSWKHQELLDMQYRYTHLVANNLIPVANQIDELYKKKTNELTFKTI